MPVMDFFTSNPINLMLLAAALVSGGMLLWQTMNQVSGGGAAVDTTRATQMINRQDAVVLDVREPAEFERSHILGARNLPLAQLESRAAEVGKLKKKPLIVYCDGGRRATQALAVLKRLGHGEVHTLTGGLGAWHQAGLPVEK